MTLITLLVVLAVLFLVLIGIDLLPASGTPYKQALKVVCIIFAIVYILHAAGIGGFRF